MRQIFRTLLLSSFTCFLLAAPPLATSPVPQPVTPSDSGQVDVSMVISGGVSLGAYEAGYNWAMIKMLSKLRALNIKIKPKLSSVAGASAGSINTLLSAVYWCQKESIPYRNNVEDNLFYETWVHLGLEDLVIKGKDPHNHSTLFTRKPLREKADLIMEQMKKPIFKEGCEIPMAFSVTKVTPIVEEFQGIDIKNQAFSIPLTFTISHGKVHIKNRTMPPSTAFYLAIPGIEKDREKIADVLFASSAFPGAFQQVKLHYSYKGKEGSGYFIDGGAFNNVPLQQATELAPDATLFLYMDPSNMRKQPKVQKHTEEEKPPVGFLSANLSPLTTTVDIYQQMSLYQALNLYFKPYPQRRLVLSSRYHPLTAGFLEHFGAFLDENFRLYDYHVGVYDAIYNLAYRLSLRGFFPGQSQTEVMNRIMKYLDLEKSPEAITAYRFFLATEFKQTKIPRNNRYAAIYYAFNLKVPENERYTVDAFTQFLGALDMRYLPVKKESFLAHARKDIHHWAKRPLRVLINRITTLENERAKIYPGYATTAKSISIAAWGISSLVKEKEGWDIFPMNAPNDKEHQTYRTALRLLPSELATDTINGGASLGYSIYWYKDLGLFSGFEFKPSYTFNADDGDFMRMDVNAFSEYNDFVKFGLGASGFGNMEGSFYQRDNAFGINAYIDVMDIFRLTYVRRYGDVKDNDFFFIGVENIPSLIYWLTR
ncbi:MAG: patatin-like phospholipase family protein [Sulfurovum sp.]|nr:patatin-like phospholipase family protein [Sulfurovum sp.]